MLSSFVTLTLIALQLTVQLTPLSLAKAAESLFENMESSKKASLNF